MSYHFEGTEGYIFNFEEEKWEKLEVNYTEGFGTRFCIVPSSTGPYLVGGYKLKTLTRVLKLQGSEFKKSTRLITGRADCCGLVYHNQLFVFGGYNEESKEPLASAEAMSITAHTWKQLPQMHFTRRNASCEVVHENIYLFGGCRTTSIERFDLHKGTWNLCELSLPVPLYNLGVYGISHNTLLLLGGVDEDENPNYCVWLVNSCQESISIQPSLHKRIKINKPVFAHENQLFLFNGKEFATYGILDINLRNDSTNEFNSSPTRIEYFKRDEAMTSSLEKGVFRVNPKSSEYFKVSLPSNTNVLVVRRVGEDQEIQNTFIRVIQRLIDYNCNVFVESDQAKGILQSVRKFNASHCEIINLVVTLGGDGTVVWAISLFKKGSMPPLLAFNMGSLGFMTSYSVETMDGVMHSVFDSSELPIELMSRLSCRLNESEEVRELGQAANEICIDRGASVTVVELDIYLNGEFCTTAVGDGVLVATPCGSTAYSLSAGGSVVHHEVPAILVTPICPHSLSFRPIILPDSVTLTIVVPKQARIPAWVGIDGHSKFKLSKGSSIEICISNYPVPHISLKKDIADWLSRLNNILHWNDRKKQKPLVK